MTEKTAEDQQDGCTKNIVYVVSIASFGIPLIAAIFIFVIYPAINNAINGPDNNATAVPAQTTEDTSSVDARETSGHNIQTDDHLHIS